MLDQIVKFFRALNSNTKPSEIANAFCLGFILGVMPKNNLLWYLLCVFFFFFRINQGAYFLMMLFGAFVAPLFDTIFDKVGYFVLTLPQLESLFSYLLDVPFVGFTRFNNSIVCGSLVCGLIMYIPLFVVMMLLVKYWRNVLAGAIRNSKLAKTINTIPFISKLAKKVSEVI